MYRFSEPFYRWAAKTWIGLTVADSTWLFPAVEAVHIVALTVLLGAVIMQHMKVFGVSMKRVPSQQVYRDLAPWTLTSLILILASGYVLMASEAMKAYTSGPFQLKMILLVAAIGFHYTFFKMAAGAEEERLRPVFRKVVATISLLLWVSVGLAGRAIGFF